MLVARHGTQWAAIQRQDSICPASDGGPQLTGRTQVNMKDRARNIKQKYLRYYYPDCSLAMILANIVTNRSGLPLPLNFDRVTGWFGLIPDRFNLASAEFTFLMCRSNDVAVDHFVLSSIFRSYTLSTFPAAYAHIFLFAFNVDTLSFLLHIYNIFITRWVQA